MVLGAEGGSEGIRPAVKINQEGESPVWVDSGGFEEARRYGGFRRDYDVLGGNRGVGIGRWGNSISAEESFDLSVFVGSEVWEELVRDLVVGV